MSSDETDDEPLSSIVAAKMLEPEKFQEVEIIHLSESKVQKIEKSQEPKLPVTIKLKKSVKPTLIERPQDVWLYLKDLNQVGPFSCLLCSEYFMNRVRLTMHYVLNHQKDYCGVCRYFVPDREAWVLHQKFHVPWACSQCIESFETVAAMRQHLSSIHQLIHCRFCHFRMPDNELYDSHLFQKHSITNVSKKHDAIVWVLQENGRKFLCSLCSKSIFSSNFYRHYANFHHLTSRCFSDFICGQDLPFKVNGAQISQKMVTDLKQHEGLGYIDLEQKHKFKQEADAEQKLIFKQEADGAETSAQDSEIKQEMSCEFDESKCSNDEMDHDVSNYEGDKDFDVTLIGLVIIQQSMLDYAKEIKAEFLANKVAEKYFIEYESPISLIIDCELCQMRISSAKELIEHMGKMHSVKTESLYTCRVCLTSFDSKLELSSHIAAESKFFEDLWICQFCDREFNNRIDTRKHLNVHVHDLEFDNCFSPHLGYKCKYCPTLFWNETERESHAVMSHFSKYQDSYYKCESCSKTYSEKIWYLHHYMEKHNDLESPAPIYLYKCYLCCTVLQDVNQMRSHFEAKHPEAKRIYCSLGRCKYKPLLPKSFKGHVKMCHGRAMSKLPTVCTICKRDFESFRALSSHSAQVHSSGKFTCKMCNENLLSVDERKLHYMLHHPGHYPYQCNECDKSFQHKSTLYMHKREHSAKIKSYTCRYCGKVFANKDSFRDHEMIHEGPRHACSYCPMRFVQRSNMLRHERRHTGERPYACSHCPRMFADRTACTSHEKSHTKSDESFSCVYCGKKFAQKGKLKYHLRKHTGENLEKCTICEKMFTSRYSLREHLKTHTDKMDAVSCPICGRVYRSEKCMLSHLRTVHTTGTYTCPLCPKLFTTPGVQRLHILKHTKLRLYRCTGCPKTSSTKRTMLRHLRKRHHLTGKEADINNYFKMLDPRECELGLDEEVITSIFGPKIKKEIVLGDFVPTNVMNKDHNDSDDTSDERDDANGEVDDNDEHGVEPTDFVSVKIEPVDESDDE